jgi:hypothetical protein
VVVTIDQDLHSSISSISVHLLFRKYHAASPQRAHRSHGTRRMAPMTPDASLLRGRSGEKG